MSGEQVVKSKRFAKEVRKVLHRHDPVGLIAEGAPVDEYEYQEAAIMRKIPACKSIAHLQDMLHEEFCHWFNPEKAGPKEKYRDPAVELYRLFRSYRSSD